MDRSLFTGLLLPYLLFAAAVNSVTPPEDYWKRVLPDTPIPRIVQDLLHTDAHVKVWNVSRQRIHKIRFIRYIYRYQSAGATKPPVHVDRSVTQFFLEEDIHRANAKMELDFTRNAPASAFVPRSVSGSIPFSSGKLPEILARFSLKPNSAEAEATRETLALCEAPTMQGETKICATSLESMVDFAAASLGTHSVRAASMEYSGDDVKRPIGADDALKRQSYTVASSVPAVDRKLGMGGGGKMVVCHHLPYPCALFYCHAMKGATRGYVVSLVGEDGSKVAALAVCHVDTSAWDPRYPAFELLKVKPGAVPICHFLQMDAIVWVPGK